MITYSGSLTWLRRLIGNGHLILVVMAMVVGTVAGAAVIGFREAISLIQLMLYGSDSERLFSGAAPLAWWQILLIPVAGGMVVGMMVHFMLPKKRPEGVADVIEASAQHGGRMSSRVGLASALVSAVLVAIIFMHSIVLAGRLSQATPLPLWLKPALAGLMVGLCGLVFPEVLGVGYGAMENALLVESRWPCCWP